MVITTLFTGKDLQSHFRDLTLCYTVKQHLGDYTKNISVGNLSFRVFDEGAFFDWHNAPQNQFIIYLEGTVKVSVSEEEYRIFSSGQILLAMDKSGKGHTTKTLSKGRSVIVTLPNELDIETITDNRI